MKKWLLFVALVLLAVGLGALVLRSGPKQIGGAEPAPNQAPPTAVLPASPAPPSALSTTTPPEGSGETPAAVAPAVPPIDAAAALPASSAEEPSGLAPVTVLENVRTAIRQYGSMFGGNPVGNNQEITAALNGNNPKQAKFIKPEAGLRVNDKGELVDPWGTPFFLHQLSGSETEIRSAGPDRKMWTSDDLVIK